jgi:hypothetical protein
MAGDGSFEMALGSGCRASGLRTAVRIGVRDRMAVGWLTTITLPNTINRYTVRSRSRFKANADSSIDLYIQKDSPGKHKEQNWLPAPEGFFALMMRLYWPKETPPSILDGSWKPPAVKEAS